MKRVRLLIFESEAEKDKENGVPIEHFDFATPLFFWETCMKYINSHCFLACLDFDGKRVPVKEGYKLLFDRENREKALDLDEATR